MKAWYNGSVPATFPELFKLEAAYRIDSLVIALEDNLVNIPSPNDCEELILALCEFDRQVNNGGFHQYLTNSSRQYAHRLASDLNVVGAEEGAQRVSAVLDVVGLPPNPNEEGYDDWITDDHESVLEDFDDYYFSKIGDCGELIWRWLKSKHPQIKLG